jgi:DNA-binding NarL/FixJ family response regulator
MPASLLVEHNAVNQGLASRLPEKKGDREKCLAGGMDAYLTKPIPPQELDELLENYLGGERKVPKHKRAL